MVVLFVSLVLFLFSGMWYWYRIPVKIIETHIILENERYYILFVLKRFGKEKKYFLSEKMGNRNIFPLVMPLFTKDIYKSLSSSSYISTLSYLEATLELHDMQINKEEKEYHSVYSKSFRFDVERSGEIIKELSEEISLEREEELLSELKTLHR